MQNDFEVKSFELSSNFKQAYSEAEQELILRKGFNSYAFLNIKPKEKVFANIIGGTKETLENFTDLGFMQALDNISATLTVISHIISNNGIINTNRIGIYGNSHGSYLGYLCNRLCPNLFKFHIDNSAWIYPNYLYESRKLTSQKGDITMFMDINYLAQDIIKDKSIFDLHKLYDGFANKCKVVCYHGETDHLVSILEKRKFCDKINGKFQLIDEDRIDNEIFKSTEHGLNADFLKLFDYSIKKLTFEKSNCSFNLQENVRITSDKYEYNFNYSNLIPKLEVKSL